ncbi:MAG: DUF4157 domain-containing protein [Snowella sp.]|nr:DUF4157 domain-containing protein [Snowella sp.]
MAHTRLSKHSLSKNEQAVSGVASRVSVREPIDEFQDVYSSRAGSAAFREQYESDFSRSGQIQPTIQAKPSFRGLSQELAAESQPVQLREEENKTGLPDDLKAGVEALSGYSMDDVRVHYNSSKPAQLQALAYTQGTEIHVGSGQEKHLAHEAWHVVQQMQGRVKPTMQMKGVQINDDAGLEKEADVMGGKALQIRSPNQVMTEPFADATILEPGQSESAQASGIHSAAIRASGEKGRLNFISLTVRDTADPRSGSIIQKAEEPVQRAIATTLNEKAIIKEAIETAVELMHKKYIALFNNDVTTVAAAMTYLGLDKRDAMSLANALMGSMNEHKAAMVAGSEVDWNDTGFAAAVAGDINGLEVNQAFLKANLLGVNSRASTMIHESTHIFRNANTQPAFTNDITGISGATITPNNREVYDDNQLKDLPVDLRKDNAQNVERFFTS